MKRKDSATDVVDVMQSLWALAHALDARSKWMQRHIGVTGPQRLLVKVVGESPGCSPGEAARRLSLNPGTVSRLAAGLEKARLLRRERDGGDARKQQLVLTGRGEALKGQNRGTVEAAVREAIATTRNGDVLVACRFIQRLTEAMEVQPPRSGAPSGKPKRVRRRPGR